MFLHVVLLYAALLELQMEVPVPSNTRERSPIQKTPQINREMYSFLPDPWKGQFSWNWKSLISEIQISSSWPIAIDSFETFFRHLASPFGDTPLACYFWSFSSKADHKLMISYQLCPTSHWHHPKRAVSLISPWAGLIFDYPIASVASYASEQLGAAAGATMHVPMAGSAGSRRRLSKIGSEMCKRWKSQYLKDYQHDSKAILNGTEISWGKKHENNEQSFQERYSQVLVSQSKK